MQVNISEMRRVTMVEVVGRVDSSNANKLGEALNERVDAGHVQVVLDLSNVEYMSSAGLREIVSAAKRVRSGNGDLRIASPSPRVKEVLELAGLDMIFQVFPTPVEAVGSF
jgi:anti-sigma B factor antagonist